MTKTPYASLESLVADLDLKEMDATLLNAAIRNASRRAYLDMEEVDSALVFASYVHRKATRKQRGHMPVTGYIEHPLRNTLRLFRYGCADQTLMVAEILHDTLEDCATEIVADFMGHQPTSAAAARDLALRYTEDTFGRDVARIVYLMSNPLHTGHRSRAEAHEAYRAHVIEAIRDPRVALAKFSDFVDNAFSLAHTLSPENRAMVMRLAAKYFPLVDVFEARLREDDMVQYTTAAGRAQMQAHIDAGRQMLVELLAS